MFGLTYLPTKDLERQLELQEELMSCRDFKRVDKIREEIRELEEKRKPIIECNIEETTELKEILYKKLEMVVKVGKRTQAEQFTKMINMLDQRILVLNMELREEAKKKAEEVQKRKAARKEEVEAVEDGAEKGTSPIKPRTGSSRWTSGFGKID